MILPGEREACAGTITKDQLKKDKDYYLKAKARIWPWLSYLRHLRSNAAGRITFMVRRHEFNKASRWGLEARPETGSLMFEGLGFGVQILGFRV